MIDPEAPLYHNPPEIWGVAECVKQSRRIARDGMGTPYPFRGYIGSHFGTTYYNGGKTIDGKWYQGEVFPFPNIPEGFEIVKVVTWGWRLVDRRKKPT